MPTSADDAPRAISEQGLAALRVAATLVHSVPGLRGRLRSGGATVAEIGRDDQLAAWSGTTGAPWSLAPCAFRAAVADARAGYERGVRLAIRGIDGDPVIDIGVPPGGATFPGGIHRVPCEGVWLYVFALCGDAATFAPLVEGVVAEVGAGRPRGRLGLRPDEQLGTALCFVEVDGGTPPADGPVCDLLGALLARFTVEQLCGAPIPAR